MTPRCHASSRPGHWFSGGSGGAGGPGRRVALVGVGTSERIAGRVKSAHGPFENKDFEFLDGGGRLGRDPGQGGQDGGGGRGAGRGGIGGELLADGLQVGGQAGRGARAAGDRDRHPREDVVGAGGAQGEDVAERGGGGVAGGQRVKAPALLDGREDRRVVERGGP